MTAIRDSIGLLVDLITAGAWGMVAFFLGARFLSTEAGAVLAPAIFLSAMTWMLITRRQESRARDLARGVCPRCRTMLTQEHEHRRWDASFRKWLPPLTTWLCRACGFAQEEPLACEHCPVAD